MSLEEARRDAKEIPPADGGELRPAPLIVEPLRARLVHAARHDRLGIGPEHGLDVDLRCEQRQLREDIAATAEPYDLADEVRTVDRHERALPDLVEHADRGALCIALREPRVALVHAAALRCAGTSVPARRPSCSMWRGISSILRGSDTYTVRPSARNLSTNAIGLPLRQATTRSGASATIRSRSGLS